MKSEFGWVRYCSCNIGCLNNSENRITKMKGSFMVAVPGARGELCSGYDRDRCGLGEVKEGVGLLTVEAIEL